jgi:hypothetical protein
VSFYKDKEKQVPQILNYLSIDWGRLIVARARYFQDLYFVEGE